MSFLVVLKLMGALALLIYGMKVMSEALQKMAGSKLRHILGAMTSNRLAGMFTGMLVTVAVQSSAATTVMTVSFVNAGLLTLVQAISVIMGANIGTTLTAWIMSAGFSFNITDFVWGVFIIGLLLIYLRKKERYVGDFLFGIAFMFFALGTLNLTGKEMNLAENEVLRDFFASFDTSSYLTILLFIVIGTVLTCMVQSSAALMAITMVFCSSGILPIYCGIALVMGENLGTTLTANVAAFTGNTQARRAAMAHLLFNLIGVTWVLLIFYPFVNFTCSLVGVDPSAATQEPVRLSFALAAFHTTFNVINTSLLIWFVPQLEKAVCWIVKPREGEVEGEFRLQYIQGGLMKTPEISVFQAQREIASFASYMRTMFGVVKEYFDETNENETQKYYERLEKYEDNSDRLEMEIAKYLGQVSNAHLSDDTKRQIRSMLREVGELESVGDACFNLARTLHRRKGDEQFTEEQKTSVRRMFGLIDQSLSQMCEAMDGPREERILNSCLEIEKQINAYQNELKEQNLNMVNELRYTYTLGTTYMDLINECEKLGDYIMNIVEARYGK